MLKCTWVARLVLRACRVGSGGGCECGLAVDTGSESVAAVEGSAGAVAVV